MNPKVRKGKAVILRHKHNIYEQIFDKKEEWLKHFYMIQHLTVVAERIEWQIFTSELF